MTFHGESNVSSDIVLVLLPGGTLKAYELVERVMNIRNVSKQTIYSHLKRLSKDGYLERREISRKNVQYRLTPKGKMLAKEQCVKSEEAMQLMLRSFPYLDGIIAECLAMEIMESAPEKLQKLEVRLKIKEFVANELKLMKEKIIRITNLSFK